MQELANCTGFSPLEAKWEVWMRECLRQPEQLAAMVAEFGSPVHLHFPCKMTENTAEIVSAAKAHGIHLQVYFARKANKCLAYVDQAISLGIGVDTASFNEMSQCLQKNFRGDRIVYSAAVKEAAAIDLALANRTTIVIDNADELDAVKQRLRSSPSEQASLALRLRAFTFPKGRHRSRFGVDYQNAIEFIRFSLKDFSLKDVELSPRIRWNGLHFHLDGCDMGERIAALHQCIDLAEALRLLDVPIEFIDMGGGFPVSYLQHESQWLAFQKYVAHEHHDESLLQSSASGVASSNQSYPYWQPLDAARWLDGVLGSNDSVKSSVAQRLLSQGIQLRCEPGRSLMNGCGITIAQVAFRKPGCNGDLLIGLVMNRTNCRTTASDFSVDPALIATGKNSRTAAAQGYFVGAYCTESEFISPRRFRFEAGVAVGDLVVFPNTAAYQMHFMESRSHQFDLPTNVIIDGQIASLANRRLDQST